ncbi:type II toxin-antitoxin system VapC family toxin [Longimicrobium sp.]|uniref:type II toxin-antitoxin system VapC family toxin n=1 Tax=Longimicrobium sp. TaxID=2029185 RepID=UPI003B3BB1E5
MYFIDSSALVKAYVTEVGTPTVVGALDRLSGTVYVSSVVVLETAAALARWRRTYQVRQKLYAKARDTFLAHCQTRFHVVHPPAGVVSTALRMIDKYHERGAGGLDLLHIATAEHIRSLLPGGKISFMCSDQSLRSVAEERGFTVFDPERDSLTAL